MSEFTMDRLRENLESLKMKNTLEILDNYLERAVADKLNIVEVLDHIFSEEAKSKRRRAYEKQIQMSGFPIKKTLDDFDFSFQPSIDKRQIDELATMRFLERPLRKFCVSVFRQNQEYHIINVHDWGLFPLATAFPGGWDGMRAGTA